ncbi:MAG: hypothetical protein HOV80_29105 [Polyangiaceae bacterium]|nr:hypothetical protein [Polyangiaceae bacterium]
MNRFTTIAFASALGAFLWPLALYAQDQAEEDHGWGPEPGADTPVEEPEPLVVAADETAPAAKPAPKVAQQPCPVCPANTEPTEKRREGVDFAASLYVLSGLAIEDYRDAGFLVRPSLDLGASFGLGSVSLYLLGSTAAIEYAKFSDRHSSSFPVMATLGVRADGWTIAGSAGISAAVDNDYEAPDDEVSLISPRGEIKAGFRFEEFLEILGHAGLERRKFDNREDVTRMIFGISFAVAGP